MKKNGKYIKIFGLNNMGDSAKVPSTVLSRNFDPHVSANTLRSKFLCCLVSDTFAESPVMLEFNFSNETKVKLSSAFFEGIFKWFCDVLGKRIKKIVYSPGQVNLIIVKDKKIHRMNRDFRGKDSSTDVISFAYLEDKSVSKKELVQLPPSKRGSCCWLGRLKEKFVIVGDIFISVDTAKRQAEGNAHTLKKELEILFVHGLLHVFGFDHKNLKEEAKMERWARKVISKP